MGIYYEMMSLIITAQQKYSTDRMQQRNWMEKRIKRCFWPVEWVLLEFLEKNGVAYRTKSAMISGVFIQSI